MTRICHIVSLQLSMGWSFVFGDEIWHFQIPRWKNLAEAPRLIFTTQDRLSVPSSMSRTSRRRKKPSRWKNTHTYIHTYTHTTSIYLFKVNSGNTRIMCGIYSMLTIKTLEQRYWRQSGIFIVNFSYNSHIVLVGSIWTGKSRLGNPFLLFIITESQHLKNNKLRIVHGNFLVLVLLMDKV